MIPFSPPLPPPQTIEIRFHQRASGFFCFFIKSQRYQTAGIDRYQFQVSHLNPIRHLCIYVTEIRMPL